MSDFAIEAKKICISFNGVQVLHDVDFSVMQGSVHALVGTNGAGKSTLVKIINGVYQKDSGEVFLFGKVMEYHTPESALASGVAMVFQDLSLIPTMTVAENIFLKFNPYKKGFLIDDRKNNEKALDLLKLIGIETEIHPDDEVSSLSVGYQQLVEIAKALSNDPKILILDEPTASLSNAEIERLFDVIRSLKNRGISIIYITHYLKDIFKICDTVTLLRDGRVAFTEKTADITLEHLISEMTTSQSGKYVWTHSKNLRVGTPLLELKDLTTRHIRNVSLSVYPGEIVGVAGLLGSGRTELMRAVFGIDRIISGEILISGSPVKLRDSSQAIENGISLIPENRREQGLILDFDISENIVMPIYGRIKRGLFLIDEGKRIAISEEYIKKLDVKTQGIDQIIRYLSGGNQQKIVVAKCLASDSHILLLDDPTFGVDIQAKQEIMHIIHSYAEKGNSVLMVSSEFNEIVDFCDTIFVMKKGCITDQIVDRTTEDQLLYLVQ